MFSEQHSRHEMFESELGKIYLLKRTWTINDCQSSSKSWVLNTTEGNTEMSDFQFFFGGYGLIHLNGDEDSHYQ